MDVDDLGHRVAVGEGDVVEEAAAQEGVGQLLLIVRGDDHDRPVDGLHRLAGFVDMEFHPIELLQEVVGEFDVGLVDLVDQQHRQLGRGEGVPQFAALDVVGDVVDPLVAELAVAEAGDRVIFVEALDGAGGRLDVPFDQRRAERGGDLMGEDGLAGARLALDQQRPAQLDRGVDRDLQVVGRDIVGCAFETHGPALWARAAPRKPALSLSKGQSPRAAARASSRSNRPRFWSSSCSPPKPRPVRWPGRRCRRRCPGRSIPGRAGSAPASASRRGRRRGRARRGSPASRPSARSRRQARSRAAPTWRGFRWHGAGRPGSPRSRRRRGSRAAGRPRRSAGRGRAARAHRRRTPRAASRAPGRPGSC